ncbi:hypothetical protein ABIE58_001040 [Roseovarius sp. MBR-78]|jgi:hypothetical protein|uniref:hypothetical protein n=1 Tax=Roseovarius sp. MBR-78 TaxID=3156460 RepID=UPI0033953B35
MRRFMVLFGLLVATACTNANDLDEEPTYLGNFRLGHNVVVAPNLTKGPASRAATKEEWIGAMTEAMTARFTRYKGDKLYHLGVSVEGYVLAIPGVPVVASPKSALILNVTVWDDAAGKKLNDEPELVTVVETISPRTVIGSGLTQSKEVQMEHLSRNAAKLIETWLNRQNDNLGWFEDDGRPAKEKIGLFSGRPVDEAAKAAGTEAEATEAAEAVDEAAEAVMPPEAEAGEAATPAKTVREEIVPE